jgi:hypothetical protein
MFAIDRQRTSAGQAAGGYVTIVATGYVAAYDTWQQTVFQIGSGTSTTLETGTSGRFATVLPITATSGTVNNQTLVSPIYPLVGYIDNPHLMLVVGLNADYVEGAVITVNIYGGNHNYLWSKTATNSVAVGNQAVGFPAIRWE